MVAVNGFPPLSTDPPMASGQVCFSMWNGWACTADDGHPNYHIAYGSGGEIGARWPYEDDAP